MTLLALAWGEFVFLPPVCLAIALVTSASRHDALESILRHAMRAFLMLVFGILLFMFALSFLMEGLLP
ncbi:MAG: hypothetical protein ACT4PV_14030 [Planctomycetaceae bacterium]